MKNIIYLDRNIHSSWDNFFDNDTYDILNIILKNIYSSVDNDLKKITPSSENVLRFLDIPIDKIKVIILGQDPYPELGAATGRAFEVGILKSWLDTFKQGSLKNIIRCIYKSYKSKDLSFSNLKIKIEKNDFCILPPDKLFKNWEEQGVLLLNTAFTFPINQKSSHLKFWKPFTKKLLAYINNNNKEIDWFIWGNKAIEITSHLDIKNSFISVHPSPLAQRGNITFMDFSGFNSTKEKINWLGL